MNNREFTIAKSKIGDVLILDVASAHSNDKHTTSQLAQSLFKSIESSDFQKMLVDLKGITAMTSEVIGQLIMLIKKCQAGGFQLRLCGMNSECKVALDLVRLDQLVEMHDHKNQAVVAFKVAAQRPVEPEMSAKAADEFLELARSGDPEAQFQLGQCLETGMGADPDFTQALNWFEKAANQEHVDSRYKLGIAHAYGIGTTQDFESALDWFSQAADQGHADSQFWLGLSSHHGLVGKADTRKAIRWYKEAADQGHVEAREAITEIRRNFPDVDGV